MLAGAGGVLVELLARIVSAPAPVARERPIAMLRSLRIAALFDGYRGGPVYDIEAAADVLVRLGWLAADLGERLENIECNPLIVGAVRAPSPSICAARLTRAVPTRNGDHETSAAGGSPSCTAPPVLALGAELARQSSAIRRWPARAS